MSNSVLSMEVYLTYGGDCEGAITFYNNIFDGKVNIEQRFDNPAMNASNEYHNKVLHASLKSGNVTILASDIMPGRPMSGGREEWSSYV